MISLQPRRRKNLQQKFSPGRHDGLPLSLRNDAPNNRTSPINRLSFITIKHCCRQRSALYSMVVIASVGLLLRCANSSTPLSTTTLQSVFGWQPFSASLIDDVPAVDPIILSLQPSSPNAYVFVLTNCQVEASPSIDFPSYRPMLYSILVATYHLKHFDLHDNDPSKHQQTQADIILLIQMKAHQQAVRLPPGDEYLLDRLGIRIAYLPPTQQDDTSPSTFYTTVLAKFHIFRLIQYQRIIFLDSDILPLCSLDHLFASDLFQDGEDVRNILLHAMYDDPVNAGLFVVSPSLTSFEEIQGIILHSNFTPSHGWAGITSFDTTDAITNHYALWNRKVGSGWNFYCANSDQGLLLYWSKYIQQRTTVSIIIGRSVEHWRKGADDRLHKSVKPNFLGEFSCIDPSNWQKSWASNLETAEGAAHMPFYQDFHHAVGLAKFWNQAPSRLVLDWERWNVTNPMHTPRSALRSSTEYWWYLLFRLKVDFDLQEQIPSLQHIFDVSKQTSKGRLKGDLFVAASISK